MDAWNTYHLISNTAKKVRKTEDTMSYVIKKKIVNRYRKANNLSGQNIERNKQYINVNKHNVENER